MEGVECACTPLHAHAVQVARDASLAGSGGDGRKSHPSTVLAAAAACGIHEAAAAAAVAAPMAVWRRRQLCSSEGNTDCYACVCACIAADAEFSCCAVGKTWIHHRSLVLACVH
jgi:hypothetical protein